VDICCRESHAIDYPSYSNVSRGYFRGFGYDGPLCRVVALMVGFARKFAAALKAFAAPKPNFSRGDRTTLPNTT
jgi:hypothetical protein